MSPYNPLRADKAHDVLRQESRQLEAFFRPKNVAVIGATESHGSVGRSVLWNLISSPFGGTIYPVNPKRPNILGIKAYPTIKDVPGSVDLAVIVTPASAVPGVISECVDAGIRSAVVISAGFKEMGTPGIELERQVLERARKGKMRIIGPNCLGVMNPISGLNATFAARMARPGNVAFISQSGALLTAVLDWSFKEQVGFSAFVSTGSMLDVGWGDLIEYLGSDPKTQSILIYMESIGDAQSFISAAREVALTKPIIVIKAGRTDAAAKAAASHTGSLTGSDEVLDAAFRRSGVLRVHEIGELFHMAEALAKQPRPNGPRLAIITNAGGPGVLATDQLVGMGGELATLSEATMRELNSFLPASWSRGNPVDILGDADPERYARTLKVVAQDPGSDGMMVILTPQSMTDPTRIAEELRTYAKIPGKPVLASWMGGADVEAGNSILNRSEIPTFSYPDTAAAAFYYMWKYTYNLNALYETPSSFEDLGELSAEKTRAEAGRIIEGVRADQRTVFDEYESKQLLKAYGIPTVSTAVARSKEEAVRTADSLDYPVVLKLYSKTITHKTDVGGVKLNLRNADEVRSAFDTIEQSVTQRAGKEHFQGVTVQPMIRLPDAYEIIIGSSIDPQFGPVLLFGSGGQLVEVYKDRALALPPLNATLSRRMMEQTRIYRALHGVRGRKAVNLPALEQLLVRFSQLVVDQPWIAEIDINPLLASPEGILALDARVILHDAKTDAEKLPRPCIRPYPIQYIRSSRLTDGGEVVIRPICPEDEPQVVKFHQRLSERSVRLRYFQPLDLGRRTTHERLLRVCFADYDRQMALVVERTDASGKEKEIIAIGRLTKLPSREEAEFAVLVNDQWQRRGVGTLLLQNLLSIGRDERIHKIQAEILQENVEMQAVCRKLGFTLTPTEDRELVHAEIRF